MMKKHLIFILTILLFLGVSGCMKSPKIDLRLGNDLQQNSKEKSAVREVQCKDKAIITVDQALKLCLNHLGHKDEETGFSLSYQYLETADVGGSLYYIINRTWIVDEDNSELSHPSFIGYAVLPLDGSVIYDGMKNKKGGYELSEILWKATECQG